MQTTLRATTLITQLWKSLSRTSENLRLLFVENFKEPEAADENNIRERPLANI